MKRVFIFLAGITVLTVGCQSKNAGVNFDPVASTKKPTQSQNRLREYRSELEDESTVARQAPAAGEAPALPGMMGQVFAAPQALPPAQGGNGNKEPPAKPEAAPARKIIRTGNADLVVPDLDTATLRLQRLVEEHKGFVGHSEVRGTKGEHRTATWTIRIPVDEYETVMDALPKLGEALSVRTDSQDVSEEYYDIEARLKNKQVEEKRLLEHLQKSTGKLEEILAVEKELSRVREEIERFQGRLNKLSNLTSLTTITISMQEIKDYVPPSSPSFGTSISRTFDDSAGTLGSFLRNVVLFVVAAAPWLPLLAVVIGVPWWLIRRRVRSVPTVSPALPAGNQS
jgi:Domain of unknown function (DUF4349)